MPANTIVLEGEVTQRDALRSTPGGVAVLKLVLHHRSTQREAGSDAAVEVEMQVVAYGEMAQAMSEVSAGSRISVKGFLSRKNRNSMLPVLHINQFKYSDRG